MTKKKWTVSLITAAAAVGVFAATGMAAGAPTEAGATPAADGTEALISGERIVEAEFEVDEETGEVRDAQGNVIGRIGENKTETYRITDDEGNPIDISIGPIGENENGAVVFSVCEDAGTEIIDAANASQAIFETDPETGEVRDAEGNVVAAKSDDAIIALQTEEGATITMTKPEAGSITVETAD